MTKNLNHSNFIPKGDPRNSFQLVASIPEEMPIFETEGAVIREIPVKGLYSIAPFHGKSDDLSAQLKETFALSLPQATKSLENDKYRIFASAKDQYFISLLQADILDDLFVTLQENAAVTDQSDSWVCFELSGAQINRKLEKLFMIDTAQDRFHVGMVARTMMEHMGCFVMRLADDENGNPRYHILVARSFGESAKHALAYPL